MQVGSWGNSLTVRLPAAAVEALGLKEGDEIEVAGERSLRLARDDRREKALEGLRALQRPFPPDYRFDREELHERGE